MISSIIIKNKLDQILPKILVASIIFYFYKTAFWPLTYLFIGAYVLFFALLLLRGEFKFRMFSFAVDFLIPIILLMTYVIISFFNRQISDPIIKKDILLMVVLFSLFYSLFWINSGLRKEIPIRYTLNFIVYVTLIISCLNLINVFFSSIIPSETLLRLHITESNTLAGDYNYYSLFILFGLIVLNYKHQHEEGIKQFSEIKLLLLNFIFSTNIILSGSRRAIIVFFLLFLIYVGRGISKEKHILQFKLFSRNLKIIFTSFIVLVSVSAVIFYFMPKDRITFMLSRYTSFIGINDYYFVNNLLWEPENKFSKKSSILFNQENINVIHKFWKPIDDGTKIRKVDTQYGKGIKVLQRNRNYTDLKIYCKMPAMAYFANHTYEISFKTQFIVGNVNSLTVRWLTDDGNHGSKSTTAYFKEIDSIGNKWYDYTAKYTFIDNHAGIVLSLSFAQHNAIFIITNFKIKDLDYNPDLPALPAEINNNQGLNVWMNRINYPVSESINLINNGDFKHDLAFWSYGADSLKIAVTEVDGKSCAHFKRGDGDGDYFSLFYVGRNILFKAKNEYQLSFNLKTIQPKNIPFLIGYWVNEGQGYMYNLSPTIDTLKNGWCNVKVNYTFKNDQSSLVFPINSQTDHSEFYITDISLVNLSQPQYNTLPLTEKTESETIMEKVGKNSTFSDRTSRWLYANELWMSEYKWYNKLIGHGHDYLLWYGKKFNYNVPDWPHNPFISILLYSGVIGLLLYFWLLFKVVSLYLKYRKQYGIAFFGFLITFFFSFFSGGHPFDPPIMGFFIMLPFLIHSIHKRDKENVK